LTGWRSDYSGESIREVEELNMRRFNTTEPSGWEKRGEEVVGRHVDDVTGTHQESVLQYQRPIVEDGTIEYEFDYDPGKSLVHPALDRLTFQLGPDGVKVHGMTDAPYDRTGLAPDNARAEPENRRGPETLPLKARAWNKMTLALAGDSLTLTLNGLEINAAPPRTDQYADVRPLPLCRRDRGAGPPRRLSWGLAE
jgi:hypothetical protein